jgi:transcriptional regulator with XRE-family HTH domain
MPTRETRGLRGERRGKMLVARVIRELQVAREDSNVSLAQLAAETGSSESALSRLERLKLDDVGVVRLSEIASALGY